MRRGFDGLAADVAQTPRAEPYSGAAFVFRSKRGDYVKILAWDGFGLCLFAKGLEKGRFVVPSAAYAANLTRARRHKTRRGSNQCQVTSTNPTGRLMVMLCSTLK